MASTAFVIVLVVSPMRQGKIASAALNFPTATSDATENAAECVSAKPATAAATMTPVFPSQELSADDATSTPLKVAAKTSAAFKLKAEPNCTVPETSCRIVRNMNKAAKMHAAIPAVTSGIAK